MEILFTNKIDGIDLEKLMDIYEESNWENLSRVRDIVGGSIDSFDKKYLYEIVRKSYCDYITKYFLKNDNNNLAILINEEEYLAALRIYDEGEFFLLEALETNPIYRRMGYGERLVREVVKSLERGKEIRAEVGLSNKKSLALHKKVGFKPKIKEESHWVLSIRG